MPSALWEVAISEDGRWGYLLDADDLPADRDGLLGVFVVLARREFDTLFDPRRLLVSAQPRAYRLDEAREEMVPTIKRKAEVWAWVITGLEDAEAIPMKSTNLEGDQDA